MPTQLLVPQGGQTAVDRSHLLMLPSCSAGPDAVLTAAGPARTFLISVFVLIRLLVYSSCWSIPAAGLFQLLVYPSYWSNPSVVQLHLLSSSTVVLAQAAGWGPAAS